MRCRGLKLPLPTSTTSNDSGLDGANIADNDVDDADDNDDDDDCGNEADEDWGAFVVKGFGGY